MTGSRYLRRKRILGISAIVLAMLLVALPVFSRAEDVETTLNERFDHLEFDIMCTNAGLCGRDELSEVRCVTTKEGDGWIECGDSEDPNMICVRLNGTVFEIYMPETLTKVNTDHMVFFDQYANAEPFDINALLRILDTSNYTSMQEMFSYDKKAESIDVSNFNTANVNNMSSMFIDCESLTSLHLTRFNTSNVTQMYDMFKWCNSLQDLDLSSFNTENVLQMSGMFQACPSLKSLDLSNFDTASVTTMENMFNGDTALEYLNLSSFTVTVACSVDNMLTNCPNLNIIRTPGSTAKEIVLPDTYYHLYEYGSWEMDETNPENRKAYTVIPVNSNDQEPKSMILIKEGAVPTVTPEAILTPTVDPTAEVTQIAVVSPTAEVTQEAEASPSPEVTQEAEVSPSPSPEVTQAAEVSPSPVVTPKPTPTRKPTQKVRDNSLTIVDNRTDKTGTDQIAASVSNLVGNIKFVIEDDDGEDIKKQVTLTPDQTLVAYNINLIDENGSQYKDYKKCTVTIPVPSSMDLTKGELKLVTPTTKNVLENVPLTKVVKNNVNCVQFLATTFGEYGFLYTPYGSTTGAVTSPTPSVTTTPSGTPSATKSATPKPSTTNGASGGSSGSNGDKKSSSNSTNGGSSAKPVSSVKGYSNAKDMPKTGDGDVFRILGAVILFLFGSIELLSSIREKTAE